MSIALSSNVRARVIASHEMHRRFKGRRIDATHTTRAAPRRVHNNLPHRLTLHTHSFTHTKSSCKPMFCWSFHSVNVSKWSAKKGDQPRSERESLLGVPRNISKVGSGKHTAEGALQCQNEGVRSASLPLSHSLTLYL